MLCFDKCCSRAFIDLLPLCWSLNTKTNYFQVKNALSNLSKAVSALFQSIHLSRNTTKQHALCSHCTPTDMIWSIFLTTSSMTASECRWPKPHHWIWALCVRKHLTSPTISYLLVHLSDFITFYMRWFDSILYITHKSHQPLEKKCTMCHPDHCFAAFAVTLILKQQSCTANKQTEPSLNPTALRALREAQSARWPPATGEESAAISRNAAQGVIADALTWHMLSMEERQGVFVNTTQAGIVGLSSQNMHKWVRWWWIGLKNKQKIAN